MKLIGNLRKQVESEGTMEGRKKLIEKAGMKLTDDELENVSGGVEFITLPVYQCQNENCRQIWGTMDTPTECPLCYGTEFVIITGE